MGNHRPVTLSSRSCLTRQDTHKDFGSDVDRGTPGYDGKVLSNAPNQVQKMCLFATTIDAHPSPKMKKKNVRKKNKFEAAKKILMEFDDAFAEHRAAYVKDPRDKIIKWQ